jgi:DNA uptake protein ComE-like DNA-binding protein
MKQVIKDYFTFSKKEQHGIVVLSCLIFLVILANILTPYLGRTRNFDFSSYAAEIETFYKALEANTDTVMTISQTRYQKKWNDQARPFQPQKKPEGQQIPVVEINSADSAMLDGLKGIGPKLSVRIIRYRDLLGGFYRKEQLMEVYGMDSTRVMPLLSHITVDTLLIRKIDVNRASFGELLRHPYLDINAVKAIMNYRKKSGLFHSIDEIKSVNVVGDSIYSIIRPYLVASDTI